MAYVQEQFASWINECLPGGSAWGGPHGRMIISSSGIQGLYGDRKTLHDDDVKRLHRIYEREFPDFKKYILRQIEQKNDEVRQKAYAQEDLLAVVKKQSEQIDKLMATIAQITEQNAQFINFLQSTQPDQIDQQLSLFSTIIPSNLDSQNKILLVNERLKNFIDQVKQNYDIDQKRRTSILEQAEKFRGILQKQMLALM